MGEQIEESVIVQNVLRSLPLRFNVKVYVLEELRKLNKLTMDELHGILVAYKMHTKKEKPSRREVTIKASKKIVKREDNLSDNSNDDSNAKEAKVVRKLDKGIEKYKYKCWA